MATNLCFGLTCLLIPVLIELFNLQAGFRTTNTGHALIEILILSVIFWMFIQILRLDKWLYLHYYLMEKSPLESKHNQAMIVSRVQPTSPAEQTTVQKTKAASFHQPHQPFVNIPKHHRTVKQ
ncbi:MAG TPA: hypothetical protein VIO61_01395 [Anaerolineaceae bacterium]